MNNYVLIHFTFDNNWNVSYLNFLSFEQFNVLMNSNEFCSVWGELNSPLIVNIVKLTNHSWLVNNGNSINLQRMINLALNHPYIAYTNLNTDLTHIFTLTHSFGTKYLILDDFQNFSKYRVLNYSLSSLDLNFEVRKQYINSIPLIMSNCNYNSLLNNFNNTNLQQNYLIYSLSDENNLSEAYETFQNICNNHNYPSILVENIKIKQNKVISDAILKNWSLSNFEVCKINTIIEEKYK